MEDEEQQGNKKNSKRKWQRDTHLWRTIAHDTKWWISYELFLDDWLKMVRKLMDEMDKVLLRGVVTLKVHEEYGYGEV